MMQEAPKIPLGMMQEAPTPLIGYRFSPTDEEIILHYLHNKIHRQPLSSPYAIIECDLYGDKNAWTMFFDQSGESTLYFFTKLRKKTVKGSRVERVTSCGTWRAQSDNKIVTYHGNKELHIGSRRNFTFVSKKESGVKGRWVMHEYRLDGIFSKAKKDVDDYVLCRVKKKKPTKKEEEKIVKFHPVNNSVSISPTLHTSEDLERILLDSNFGEVQPVNNNVSITPAWNASEDLGRILLDSSFGQVQPVNNNVSITPAWNASEDLERIQLDSSFGQVQPVNNNVSITPAWNPSEDSEGILLHSNFGQVQPVNNNVGITPARNPSEDLARILLDSNLGQYESELSLNHGITPQELEDIISKG